MPEYLTYDRALELLREVVAEVGEDHVYDPPEGEDGCLYVHGDGPGCIVAHVMVRAGVSLEELRSVELSTPLADGTGPYGPGALWARWGDRDALRLLFLVQEEQDSGRTWGEAVDNGVALFATPPVGDRDE